MARGRAVRHTLCRTDSLKNRSEAEFVNRADEVHCGGTGLHSHALSALIRRWASSLFGNAVVTSDELVLLKEKY